MQWLASNKKVMRKKGNCNVTFFRNTTHCPINLKRFINDSCSDQPCAAKRKTSIVSVVLRLSRS